MPETLASILRKRQADALVSDAKYIADWPEGSERSEQAELLIREAMYRCTLGRISYEEQTRIFSILAFAMPGDYAVESSDHADLS